MSRLSHLLVAECAPALSCGPAPVKPAIGKFCTAWYNAQMTLLGTAYLAIYLTVYLSIYPSDGARITYSCFHGMLAYRMLTAYMLLLIHTVVSHHNLIDPTRPLYYKIAYQPIEHRKDAYWLSFSKKLFILKIHGTHARHEYLTEDTS